MPGMVEKCEDCGIKHPLAFVGVLLLGYYRLPYNSPASKELCTVDQREPVGWNRGSAEGAGQGGASREGSGATSTGGTSRCGAGATSRSGTIVETVLRKSGGAKLTARAVVPRAGAETVDARNDPSVGETDRWLLLFCTLRLEEAHRASQ